MVDLRLGPDRENHEGARLESPIDQTPATASGPGSKLPQAGAYTASYGTAVRGSEAWSRRFELLPGMLSGDALTGILDRCELGASRRMPEGLVRWAGVGQALLGRR